MREKSDKTDNLSGASSQINGDGKTREEFEKSEKVMKTVTNKTAPSSRYQTEQQVMSSTDGNDASTPKTSFNKVASASKGSQLKQQVASKLLLDRSDYAGVPGGESASAAVAGLRTMSYSGDAGTILGTAANTPVVGESRNNRSNGRFGKMLDATSKKINFLASEQVISSYDNPAPLGESGNEVQGYYGTPKNSSIRSQKAQGGTPADLNVERSVDEITRDAVVFATGQYVLTDSMINGTDPRINTFFPTRTTYFDSSGSRHEDALDQPIVPGNWWNRSLTVKLSRDTETGAVEVTSMKYASKNMIKDGGEEEVIVNKSATHIISDMNAAELARQLIDDKAGRETQPNWSPLGRAVLEPTQTVELLQQIENDIGANVYTSYKFATKAHSYQLNKAAKDGQRVQTPRGEMLQGDICANLTSAAYTSPDAQGYTHGADPFQTQYYQNGSAATLIALFDSVAKYQTKADILLQPKSLRKAIYTADNNMNVFRMKEQTAKAINAVDCFSTVNRGYDPLMPVLITDKVKLFSSFSYDRLGSWEMKGDGKDRKKEYVYTEFNYSYANRSSNYTVKVKHPLLEGISEFIQAHKDHLWDVLTDKSKTLTSVEWKIPIHSSSRTFALWDFLVLYATPYILRSRINVMRDLLDFEVNFEYPFKFKSLAELNPCAPRNYGFTSIDDPLTVKTLEPAFAVSWVMPEFFWGVGQNADSANAPVYVAPWYFSELEIDLSGSTTSDLGSRGAAYSYEGAISMPVIRSGVRLENLDLLYSLTERDIRLCLDRMTRLPMVTIGGDQVDPITLDINVYKYGQANDGIPCFKGNFTVTSFYSVPREEGLFFVDLGSAERTADWNVASSKKLGIDSYPTGDAVVGGGSSYRVRCYKGVTTIPTDILTAASVNIDRAQAFRQYWDERPAQQMNPASNPNAVSTITNAPELGVLLSLRECWGEGDTADLTMRVNAGCFIPFTLGRNEGGADVYNPGSAQKHSTNKELTVVAIHKGLWSRIQKLPQVLSPWDTCDFNNADNGANYDPYDFAYAFGLAGMMASDYTQDLYNRTNQVQNQGWLYISDPFIEASPLYR